MALSWPDHLLTLAEWEALPESNELRLELAEGMLVLSPKPMSFHQHAGNRLTFQTNEHLPRSLIALADVEVVLAEVPLTIRVPDMTVTRTELYNDNPPRYRAGDVLLAVEILSDGTRRIDRVLKLSEYADAGIPQYWIVDLGSPTMLLAYQLANGNYELSGEHTGQVELSVAGHPVSVDLDALTRR